MFSIHLVYPKPRQQRRQQTKSLIWSRPIVAIWLFFDADFQRHFERHIESLYPFYTEKVKNVGRVKYRSTDRENKSKSPGKMRRLSQNDNCDETANYTQPVYDTSLFPVTFSDTSKA